ncbi:hypothetical protein FACS1894216_12530 [Synergistales bacterium]|nr:hypothetical protein FACS1894216_12530 [Synergistales bacterium]
MSRIKVISIIIIIAVTIIVFGVGTGLIFVRGNLEKTIENDMYAVANIADRLISTKIDLLKADAATAAWNIITAAPDDVSGVLKEQVKAYPDKFIGLTVIDRRHGIVESYGSAETPETLRDSEYIPRAFAGEAVISTTGKDLSGKIVFHVYVPMEERVLSATVPGLFFSDIISQFNIWETGNIFIVDADGYVIANVRENWVMERYNFIEKSKTDSRYEKMGAAVSNMIKGESGVERFALDGEERLCVYTPISGSRVGWTLGVAVPLMESPIQNVRYGLLLVGGVCLLLSIVASLFASAIIERPYQKISELAETLKTQDKLLRTINDAAAKLQVTETGDFRLDVLNCMDMMARCADMDRMCVWQNHTKDGELYCSQIYEWSGGAEPQAGKDITKDISYSENLPGWEEKLSGGKSISGLVGALSDAERAQLSPQGIVSILVIPMFVHEYFWGFVAFDDCHRERDFSNNDEENLLRSGGFLIVNAILRNEMTYELVRAREEAIASAEAKSDFLANMSHEMRTPLNAIIGLSELTLDSENLDGLTQENLEKVYNSGVTLLSLINDILDISKIESRKFELIPVEYDTPSLINDTVTLNIVRIGSKPVTFELDIDESMPNRLIGDELRIKQIFNNLLSNAFKYTKEGSVVWSVSFEQDGDDMWIVSSVKDSGIGIRPDDLKKIFSEYNQADTKSNRKIEGTGLGLSICKSIVELMDGTVTVESEYGKGSTFTARIRQGKAEQWVPIGPEVAANLKDFRYSESKRDRSAKLVRAHIPYARVLVVDDVATNLDVALGMMKPYGMQIDCVSSGSAAVDLIRDAAVKYNAVFMDHMMPGMDGIEATRIIREEIGTDYAKNIPVIALTANAIVGNEDMFLQKGFQAFLSKPIDIMRMDVVINRYVRDKDLEKKSAAEGLTVSLKESGSDSGRDGVNSWFSDKLSVEGIDLRQGLKRFGEDEEIYLDVLKSYAQNTPTLLTQLRGYTREDVFGYEVVVHGIKSSSRGIGALSIGARAEALECAAKAGNFAFIEEKNDGFIETVQTLLANLSAMLQKIADENPKPRKAEPDASVLASLREACENFDIDAADKAISELESCEYESGGDLVEWLSAQVRITGFTQITERLRSV